MIKHIKSLTSLRGIAALFIVMHHFSRFLLPDIDIAVSSHSKFLTSGYLWVDFFFILSGFILTHVYVEEFMSEVKLHDYKPYLFSRFARLYPVHICILLFFVGLELIKAFLLTSSAFTGQYSPTALLCNIFLIQVLDLSTPPLFNGHDYWNEPAWSISAEWMTYIILPFLISSLTKASRFFNLLIYIIVLAGLHLLTKLGGGTLDGIGLPSIIRCVAEATLGIITYRVYSSIVSRKYSFLSISAGASIIWILLVMHYHWRDALIMPAFCILILSISVNSTGVISKVLNSKPMFYLGTISYSIYMVHWFIQESLRLVWQQKFHVNFGDSFNTSETLLALLLCIVTVLAAASAIYHLVEEPMRHYLKNVAFSKRYFYQSVQPKH